MSLSGSFSSIDCKVLVLVFTLRRRNFLHQITLTSLTFCLATRMKREWFPFSRSRTVPSPPRQGQGPLKSPCPSVSGSAPPLTPQMPTGRTGSSWLKSSTQTGLSFNTLNAAFHSRASAAIYILLSQIKEQVCFLQVRGRKWKMFHNVNTVPTVKTFV